VRLCAEDPERDYLPTTGTLLAVDVPPTVRADLGVVAGSEVGIHYDSMLGKIIAHAPTRREAAQVLRRALEQTWVPGLVTNREHLVKILAHPAFLEGAMDTHFLERHAGELAARSPGLDRVRVAVVGAVLAGVARRRSSEALAPIGWRNVRHADQTITFTLGDHDVIVGYRDAGEGLELSLGGKVTKVSQFGLDGDRVWFVEHGNHRRSVRVAIDARQGPGGSKSWVLSEGLLLQLVEQPRFPDHASAKSAGGLIAPMPGKVVKVLVTVGQEVAAGTALIVLEAMKMEHTVRATETGTVQSVSVAVGDQVDTDQLLAVVA
jgi:propionyl-CoA carboxylase alpha chain